MLDFPRLDIDVIVSVTVTRIAVVKTNVNVQDDFDHVRDVH